LLILGLELVSYGMIGAMAYIRVNSGIILLEILSWFWHGR